MNIIIRSIKPKHANIEIEFMNSHVDLGLHNQKELIDFRNNLQSAVEELNDMIDAIDFHNNLQDVVSKVTNTIKTVENAILESLRKQK